MDENQVEEFSLADLADLDVSDIAEIRFESLPAGAYEFEVVTAELGEKINNDGEKRFIATFGLKVVSVKAVLEANVDKESLVGKVHTETLFINPGAETEKVQKAIGRLRATISDMGLNSAGKLGEIVVNTKGHIFVGKIVKQKDKEDKSIEYARLKLDPPKK